MIESDLPTSGGHQFVYVNKKALENLQSRLTKQQNIKRDMVCKLVLPNCLDDEETAVPVDLQGLNDVDQLMDELGPKGAAEAILKAKESFEAKARPDRPNSAGDSRPSRHQNVDGSWSHAPREGHERAQTPQHGGRREQPSERQWHEEVKQARKQAHTETTNVSNQIVQQDEDIRLLEEQIQAAKKNESSLLRHQSCRQQHQK